ncbi:MAG: MATE family efflux transporter [Tissierellia bacterium]|nr:MATE family efflux transporter [Tissierellia bacterium]
MQEIKENKMGYLPEKKLLFTMSLPIIISMLVQSIYNVVDSIFVSRISEDALTAVSLSFPIQNLMIAVGVGTGVGVNALLSRYLGMKEYKRANSVATHGMLLSLFSYLIFFIIGLLFVDKFFISQTDSQIVRDFGADYLSVIALFSIGVFVQITCERLLQSTGLTLYTMFTQMTGALVNIILDPILIFGLFGFPALNVKGAAIATVIGQCSGAVVGLILNFVKNKEIKISLKNFKLDMTMIFRIYEIGLPSIVMSSIGSVMVFFMNKILILFTQTAVAVLGVMFKLQSFIFMPVFGLSNGMVPIIAYNYGARKPQRIKNTIKIAIIAASIMTFVGFLIFQIFPDLLLSLFDASKDMKEIGRACLRRVSLSYLVVGFSIVAVSVFQSMGHGFMALLESFLRQLIVLLPSAYLLSKTNVLENVWYSFFIAEIFAAVISFVFLKKIYEKEINKLDKLKQNLDK